MIKNAERPYVVEVVSHTTATRVLGTLYRNTTGRTKYVVITCDVQSGNVADPATASCQVDGVTNGFCGFISGLNGRAFMQMTFFVPPGSTFEINKLQSGTGSLIINTWIEAS